LNDIGRNSLLGNRKKKNKFLIRTFNCRSTFLYGCGFLFLSGKMKIIFQAKGRAKRGWGRVDNRGRGGGMEGRGG
jgi:hypothetical protein